MATLTATRAASTFPVYGGTHGNLRVAYGTYEIAANPTAADIVQMVRLPAGAVVVGGWVFGDDLDTGTEALDFDIGWAANGGSGTYDSADPDGFGNLGVVDGDTVSQLKPVAGIYYPLQGVLFADGPVTFTKETTIQLVFNVAAATGGTGTISITVLYVVP